MSQWHEFYRAANFVEARLLQGMLSKMGIESRVDGEYAMAAAGELPMDVVQVTLMVELAQWDKAKQAVKDYEVNSVAEWTCNKCQEINPGSFDYCWSCEQEKSTK
ncbi:DUF2007 domain-containing protein [Agarivorans sp. B2Z047]|uniref:putative signal transducing protein n=1 Tax=Agarivorans sp. B2Z047 TaxID=2652721 RepID=UPI00128C67DE|nr:DUF2007 domain-containing protein [Agarivorans sp. B2Z047]MPW29965.1 DUF2007 domain-containing protein [Agarivorans sp. B2Z047]UQN43537.1 DUF2007 domain-containing protein [Agarivorans sp. B2Z047]